MLRRVILLSFILAAASLGGIPACGDGNATGNGNDASVPPDGSGIIDNDHDGYPADQDCDDQDPEMYPGRARACQSECADGWEICLGSGLFTDCSATEVCSCETPGDLRQVVCGMCGTGQSVCGLDQMWSFPTDCQGEGDCISGTQDQSPCEFAGTRSRLCSSECEYLAWDDTDCSGECTPDATEITSVGCPETWEKQQRQCNVQYTWETIVPCTADCWLPARTGTADFRDDVCIPAGPALMGADPGETGNPCDEPEHTVVLSAYLIDIYEVTVARYRACVEAEGCLEPVFGSSNYYLQNVDSYPVVGVTWDEAVAFCNWDGRRLPTEAEWEKAARGPAPRDVQHPWGDDPATCTLVPADDCPSHSFVPVDSNPAGASFYGVQQFGGNAGEWVHDWYDCSYYGVSPEIDPTGPATGDYGWRVVRGLEAGDLIEHQDTVVCRHGNGGPHPMIGFRCARNGVH